ncbi:YfcE family phosphodiesterase [Aliarcobacter butzleri]|uniref:YfcE family phosphodiesterase n=1 Tax=Aliarcobacter butzleri TaxID=28197 RepID=UPI00125F569A|nr:YfcE family phosphodiesterase [Aliarcobacter butzleri]MCT7537909.1 YfcE family phosphodiesterase [Aliarcobacter butzleri]MCT7568670.1 YfcE family phosphodiesterase [Aliarcobacter butzleri]MCT7601001.1 YfcE family phosphodiesterase [Aliarcobacter butzleri]MCT7605138.1 YfcE family phosphodiesterase [Aliarcobacter butzleri]MCT7607395.1 YfcE family phosphodiesterase [Aliarcobacter butzleri]
MIIGILSDSHFKVAYQKEVVELFKNERCEYLIHAGDFCCEKNLQLLKESNLKYIVVFGNNDRDLFDLASKYNIKSEPYYFKIEDLKFKLMHLPYHLTPDSNIVIFGHTHKFHCEYTNKTLFLNPGEVCAREEPIISCMQLEINENEYIITRYFRNINENNFMKEEFKYER